MFHIESLPSLTRPWVRRTGTSSRTLSRGWFTLTRHFIRSGPTPRWLSWVSPRTPVRGGRTESTPPTILQTRQRRVCGQALLTSTTTHSPSRPPSPPTQSPPHPRSPTRSVTTTGGHGVVTGHTSKGRRTSGNLPNGTIRVGPRTISEPSIIRTT